ncbi:hypothetical protein Fmac_005666 [Flemingia macrophylla]|uniref:Uncharacterized protein n=1 Tax=Flemingia macrophylla TaxID=520843 RepID=A0ABD1N8E9_9FABA
MIIKVVSNRELPPPPLSSLMILYKSSGKDPVLQEKNDDYNSHKPECPSIHHPVFHLLNTFESSLDLTYP